MPIDLKPCPFCGGRVEHDSRTPKYRFTIWCNGCQAKFWLNSEEWNRRAETEEEEHQLGREIAKLLNAHSRENKSDTPDFVLARYLTSCLKLFEEATKDRDRYSSVVEPEVNNA